MASRNHSHAQQGFSLMEVVIVIFLFSVLLIGLMNVFDWHQKVYLLEQAEVRATGSVRSALNKMTRYIAQGNEIIDSRTIDGTTYNSGSNAIIIEIPSINSSGALLPSTYDYVTYYVSGTNLYQVIESGANSARPDGLRQLSSAIDTLTFTYNNNDPAAASMVTVDITGTANARGSSTVSMRATDTIFLRNR